MEEVKVMVTEDRRGTAARSEFYRALSILFFYPRDTATATVQSLVSVLRAQLSLLPHEATAIDGLAQLLNELESVAETALLPLKDSYTALFDNCHGRSAVSLYEKDYGNGDAKMVWEELVRFYEHFGLNFDVRHSHDWPDHIGVELEFLHYLTFLEAAAPETDRHVYVQAQGDFLSRRLARWVSRFAGQVRGLQEHVPYGLFALLAENFIDTEMVYLGRPREQVEHWVPMQQGQPQTGAQSRTIIPIITAAELEAFHF